MPQPDTPPPVPPGLYRLRPDADRWWRHDELSTVYVIGVGWCVVPTVALAALPPPPADWTEDDPGLRVAPL